MFLRQTLHWNGFTDYFLGPNFYNVRSYKLYTIRHKKCNEKILRRKIIFLKLGQKILFLFLVIFFDEFQKKGNVLKSSFLLLANLDPSVWGVLLGSLARL